MVLGSSMNIGKLIGAVEIELLKGIFVITLKKTENYIKYLHGDILIE